MTLDIQDISGESEVDCTRRNLVVSGAGDAEEDHVAAAPMAAVDSVADVEEAAGTDPDIRDILSAHIGAELFHNRHSGRRLWMEDSPQDPLADHRAVDGVAVQLVTVEVLVARQAAAASSDRDLSRVRQKKRVFGSQMWAE